MSLCTKPKKQQDVHRSMFALESDRMRFKSQSATHSSVLLGFSERQFSLMQNGISINHMDLLQKKHWTSGYYHCSCYYFKLTRFWGLTSHRKSLGCDWTRRGAEWVGESSEGTGDMRDVSLQRLTLSSLSVPFQGLSLSSAAELLIYFALHV